MDDVVKSIKAHLYDRVVSPLFGAFLISWAIWNYRIIFVLLSSEVIPYKFNYIDEYYSSMIYFGGLSISKCWAVGIAAPLLSALSYIYLYPFFALPVYKFSLSRQKKLADTKNEIEGATLLTLEKSRKIIQDAKRMQVLYDKKIDEVEEEIERLKGIISDQEKEISALRENYKTKKNIALNDSNEELDIDQVIFDGIKSLSSGESFKLFELFGGDVWSSFNGGRRHALEKQFKIDVINKKYPEISIADKDSSGQQIYVFKPLSDVLNFKLIDKILDCWTSNPQRESFSISDVSNLSGLHAMEAAHGIDVMESIGFVRSFSRSGGKMYELLPAAREYIVKNELHGF